MKSNDESVRLAIELPRTVAVQLEQSALRHDRTAEQEARRILRTMLQPLEQPRPGVRE